MAQPQQNGSLPDTALTDAAILLFNEIQHPKKVAFLTAFAACGQLGASAKCASIDRTMVWHWRQDDPVFAEAFERAKHMAAYTLRDEMVRRALGWNETRLDENGIEHTVRKHSDTLLIFALKGLLPEEFRESYPREKGQDISDLLKAVLLELHQQRQDASAIPAAAQPVPTSSTRLQLPPPAPEDEAPVREPRPW